MRTPAGWLELGLLAVLVFSRTASAYFLDDERRFDVRLRVYSQVGLMMQDSETVDAADRATAASYVGKPPPPPANATPAQIAAYQQSLVAYRQARKSAIKAITPPTYSLGDLAQHRNFYNPEFDANLTDFMHWAGADEFKFRFAWWGFYDGIYDYLDPEWAKRSRGYKTRFSESDFPANESYTFNDHNKRTHDVYAHQNRINELYFDYTSGPFFLRVGRQAISWGESDTIALLDVSNPFDLTLGAPGFYQDVEEARIPLWTIRSTFKLIDNLGPIASVFSDVYLVPGPIDTTVPINPIAAGVSPFNPDQADPQYNVAAQGTFANGIHTTVVDRLPAKNWGNSRWGARLTGVLLRDYTVQTWFFRTFNQAPVPFLTNAAAFGIARPAHGPSRSTYIDARGQRCDPSTATVPCMKAAPAVTLLERRLESVVGLAATWFSQPLNGILKAEAEYFNGELGVIPHMNLNPRVQIPKALRAANEKDLKNSIPTADYIRWVIGYDRNFFVPWLNPTNSFILVASYNSSFNLSEKAGMDFRNASTKLGKPNTRQGKLAGNPLCSTAASKTSPLCIQINDHDYEDAYQYEGFLQTTLRTDYFHGKLEPQLTIISDVTGIFAFAPTVSYRLTDNLLLSGTYLGIESTGRKTGIGTFRGHDMLQLRVTAQLN